MPAEDAGSELDVDSELWIDRERLVCLWSGEYAVDCDAGDVAALARSCSFSACAFCSSNFRRSLSDCRDDVVVVRRFSLASRSRTCRSFRSRNARCLREIVEFGDGLHDQEHTYAARFCAFLLDCAGVTGSFSSLLPLRTLCISASRS